MNVLIISFTNRKEFRVVYSEIPYNLKGSENLWVFLFLFMGFNFERIRDCFIVHASNTVKSFLLLFQNKLIHATFRATFQETFSCNFIWFLLNVLTFRATFRTTFRATFHATFHATLRATFHAAFSTTIHKNSFRFLQMRHLFLHLFTISLQFFQISQHCSFFQT